MALTPAQRLSRRRLDFLVAQRMNGPTMDIRAYRSAADAERDGNAIAAHEDAHLATVYVVTFRVPTLVGRGQISPATTIGFNVETGNYPYSEPATWVISDPVPYSPHFRKGAPVCIGLIWQEAKGHLLLGQLFVHVAKLLNWDEVKRGGGYVGWNGAAIDYHQKHYGGRPITPGLRYPPLPADLIYGIDSDESLFRTSTATTDAADLFAARVSASGQGVWS